MPSKKSKSPKTPTRDSRSKAGHGCFSFTEAELLKWGRDLGEELRASSKKSKALPRLLLEGPMGAGKTTLVRAILEGFGVKQGAEGSPTFPIAHEYRSAEGARVIHVDFYRLRSEAEVEATGILEPLWEADTLVICEWLSQFPETESALQRDFSCREIRLGFVDDPQRRSLEVVESNR